MKQFRHIGKAAPRISGRDFLTGKAQYIADIKIPRMLYAKVLRSPHSYAKIVKIDTTEAEALPGVKAVLTYKNAPKWKQGRPIQHKQVLGDTVNFIGDAVALVAADTEDIAAEATELIKVVYEPMKPVLTMEEALAPDAPQLYPELPGNMLPADSFVETHESYTAMDYGDIEKGFAEADVIVENTTLLLSGQNPMAPEATGAIVEWDGDDLVIRGSVANTGVTQLINGPVAQVPVSGVRVIPPCVGASYGAKAIAGSSNFVLHAAMLSKATKRPVALFYTREEYMTVQSVRVPSKGHFKIGLKKDGTVTAVEGEWLTDCGNFGCEQALLIGVGMMAIPGLANAKNVKFGSKMVVTNKIATGGFRGFGYLECGVLVSNTLFRGLEKINIDPVEYIKKNRIKIGDDFYHGYFCIGWQKSAGPDFIHALEKGAEAFRWKERWLGWGKNRIGEDGRINAVGFGVASHFDAGEQPSSETVELVFDGGVLIHASISEFGAGSRDVMCRIVAEELNVPLKTVRVSLPGSHQNPFEWGSTGSRSTYAVGNAVLSAARKAKKELFERSAKILKCPVELLETKDSMVFNKEKPEEKIPWIAPIGLNGCITGNGDYKGAWNIQSSQLHFTEIALDPETGKIEVLELCSATEAGQIIDPLTIKGQLDGYFPGLDLSYREETVLDARDGRVLNPNMIDYKARTFNELPRHYCVITENPPKSDPEAPFGAVGVGEPSLAPAIPAITMAIFNATGKWFNKYPIKFSDILAALKEEKEGCAQ